MCLSSETRATTRNTTWPKSPKSDTRQRTSIYIDGVLWRRFKSLLALEGKDMSPVIEQWIQNYVDGHEPAAQAKEIPFDAIDAELDPGICDKLQGMAQEQVAGYGIPEPLML